MLKIVKDSHLDHGLTVEHQDYILELYRERDGFFLETILLPVRLSSLTCGLHGPIMGEEAIPDSECSLEVRGERKGPSRLCNRAPTLTRRVTVIAGPHEGEPCVLYTAYGGPPAPREPWENMSPEETQASVDFWAKHALSR